MRFITGIKDYNRVIPRVYRSNLADFGEVAECPLAPIVLRESLEDRQYPRVVIFRGVLLCDVFGEDILATFGHLPEYPTCSKAVGWYVIWCCVYFAWPIEPSFQNGFASRSGFCFLHYGVGCPARVHHFCSPGGLSGDRWFLACCLSFPGAFHHTVLLYYGCQVSKV